MPKPSRSPFYFYAAEYQRNSGRKMNINEAITACYDDWKALPDEKKQIYKNQYEDWRIQYRINPELAHVPNQHGKPKQDNQHEMILHKRDIPCEELKTHYDRFGLERDFLTTKYLPLDLNELLSMPIYVINFQIFCKVDEEDGGEFIPAEMCILRYTLNEGITNYRQRFLKTDKIPSGYMSSCLEHSKETHQIPLKDFGEATNDYRKIYQELKTILFPSIMNRTNNTSDDDDRAHRRYLRLIQPCVFFPALEYEQTSKLLDWLQEKAEGVKPTKDTRLVNFSSIESLIMVLGELKQHRVSRDQIQKTFENAAYSFMIEERCPYHNEIGISHCSVARCHAGAKLISAYLSQLYLPERSPSTTGSEKHSQSQVTTASYDKNNRMRPKMTSQHSSTDENDSIASSHHHLPKRQNSAEITRLQQQNFQRLLSNAESTQYTNDNYLSEYTIEDNDPSNNQRNILSYRRQVLLNALQSIDKQLEELDLDQ